MYNDKLFPDEEDDIDYDKEDEDIFEEPEDFDDEEDNWDEDEDEDFVIDEDDDFEDEED
jgi:DNA-directed RNA polymerase subunit delta